MTTLVMLLGLPADWVHVAVIVEEEFDYELLDGAGLKVNGGAMSQYGTMGRAQGALTQDNTTM